ncbi:hypothetical protein HN51_007204 [Arachis hypogaea]
MLASLNIVSVKFKIPIASNYRWNESLNTLAISGCILQPYFIVTLSLSRSRASSPSFFTHSSTLQQPLAVLRPSSLRIIWLLWIIMGFDLKLHLHFTGCSYEFSAEKFETTAEVGISQPKEEHEVDELSDADWSNLTEVQLEELLLSNLDTIFKSAIKKIVASGYTEEVAKNLS